VVADLFGFYGEGCLIVRGAIKQPGRATAGQAQHAPIQILLVEGYIGNDELASSLLAPGLLRF